MKRYILSLILLFLLGTINSCNENVLEETPKDFLSPELAFNNKAGFEAALANIYRDIRVDLVSLSGWNNARNPQLGVDFDIMRASAGNNPYVDIFFWPDLNPDNVWVERMWNNYYNWVYQANTIIDRAEYEGVNWESEAEKNAIVGEARFLRAYGYHFLANMWGDVPLVLEETTGAKFDYTNAPQQEVYQQCQEDLEFAAQWMPTVDQSDGGRAPRAAANHLLAEINISLGDYDGAIAVASEVIDDANYSLITERFGQWTDFKFRGYDYSGEAEDWGDYYWDMFRKGNMNWKEGNHEAIWNIQMVFNAIGGGGSSLHLECIGAISWNGGDINGDKMIQKDTLMGRPNAGVTLNDYTKFQIWEFKDDFDRDIRNSKYNFKRTHYFLNPESAFYGELITPDKVDPSKADPVRFDLSYGPVTQKVVGTVHNGLGRTREGENHDWGWVWKDWYLMRLAETYLLRAEAYYLKGDQVNAASDINVVRGRAQATPVDPGEVNLDLILDERARELHVEEIRGSTLMRMGKLKEYLEKYNYSVVVNGHTLGDHINRFPIPNSAIEANKEAEIKQNPGYSGAD